MVVKVNALCFSSDLNLNIVPFLHRNSARLRMALVPFPSRMSNVDNTHKSGVQT